MSARKILKIHPQDDLVLALSDLPEGIAQELDGERYTPGEPIPAKHKFAAKDFASGDYVHMYGVVVGKTTRSIRRGEKITVENLIHATGNHEDSGQVFNWEAPQYGGLKDRTFQGYFRKDGKVGTANHWLVIPLVFCENRNTNILREALLSELGYAQPSVYRAQTRSLIERMHAGVSIEGLERLDFHAGEATAQHRIFPNVDGIKFLTHSLGCGGTRDDARTLCGLLAGYIDHPNVAGATVLSLGCQNAQIPLLQSELLKRSPNFDKPVIYLEQQKLGTESELMRQAIARTFTGLMQANRIARQSASISHLVFGVECGGSDGFSGISANPAIGYASDLLVAAGGAVILSEFPELCGAEADLLRRCTSKELQQRFLKLMQAYNARAEAVGSGFKANPTEGNIRDGLITDAIKSCGAAKKGGTSPIVDVLDYPEWVTKRGLNLLCTPGGDVESTTAMAGAGASVMLFSTGMGTPTGNPIAPVLKLSTSTELYRRMPDIIDFNAGPIVDGNATIRQLGEQLFELCLATASGTYVPHAVRLGQDDFIPWKRDVSL